MTTATTPKPKSNNRQTPAAQVFAKVPPQAPDLEAAVLGTLMLESEAADAVLPLLKTPECLYVPANQKVYAAIQSLYRKGSAIDLLTVTEELRKTGDLEDVGGMYYLTTLTADVATSAHLDSHVRIVLEKYMQREIIRIAGEAMNAAYEGADDVFDQLDAVQQDFALVNDSIRTSNIKSFGASLKATIADMQEAHDRGGDLLGYSTGLTKLDAITAGLSAPDLITLAAGTGEGKTTFALNLAQHIAASGTPVGFFSLEMRDRQLVWKVLSGELQEQIKNIRRGDIGTEKWHRLHGMKQLFSLPLYMYDKGGVNITELKAVARNMYKKMGVRALFIDYVQLVRATPGKRHGTREQEVNEVSKELKALAMDLDIPIVMLSQLNRLEKGVKRMYRLSDLRESGALEQDSDGVIFIYRPTEHGQAEMEIEEQKQHCTETDAVIDIAKWRLGQTGMFRVRFDGAFNKFSDYDPWQDVKPFSAAMAGAAPQSYNDYTEPKEYYRADIDESPF